MKAFVLTESKARELALRLVTRSGKLFLATVGTDGSPWIKCMFKVGNDGLDAVYMSTNTSSKRVAQLRENPAAAVYFADTARFKGVMLSGTVRLRQDAGIRERFWSPGCTVYYPLGVTDPDYTILEFVPESCNVYTRLRNITFPLNPATVSPGAPSGPGDVKR